MHDTGRDALSSIFYPHTQNSRRKAGYIARVVHFQVCPTSIVVNTLTQESSHYPTTLEYDTSVIVTTLALRVPEQDPRLVLLERVFDATLL